LRLWRGIEVITSLPVSRVSCAAPCLVAEAESVGDDHPVVESVVGANEVAEETVNMVGEVALFLRRWRQVYILK